jgi:indolepyruvate decarboxylase
MSGRLVQRQHRALSEICDAFCPSGDGVPSASALGVPDAVVEAVAAQASPRRLRGGPRPAVSAQTFRRSLPHDSAAVVPSDIACAINDLFDAHGAMPMTSDIGDCLFTAMEIENTELAAPGYYAGMGFGVPAGFGVAASTGKRPLVLVGDGAFQMTGFELGN